MPWAWLLCVAGWTLACSALLAAFSTFEMAWAALIAGGAGVTLVWFGFAIVLWARRRWSRLYALCWAAWPVAVGVVGLLHATDLPMTLRVVASKGALSEFVESRRTRGRAGLVVVFDRRDRDGCVFLTAGSSSDGIAGVAHVASGEPPNHPDYAVTDSRRLTGPWWYFKTRT